MLPSGSVIRWWRSLTSAFSREQMLAPMPDFSCTTQRIVTIFHVRVRTILTLLRPAAAHSRLTGEVTYNAGERRVPFQYEIVRMWEQPLVPCQPLTLG
jgi:hypothetical protein